MNLIFDFIVDLLFRFSEKGVKNIQNEKKQIIAAAISAAVTCLAAVGLGIWKAIDYYREGKLWAAIVFAVMVVLVFLLLGFVVIRRIARNRKKKIEP